MSFKSEMLEKVSLKEIVERRTTLHPNGKGKWKGISPFSTEKTPSFYVDEKAGIWKCFSSGKSGGIIAYFMETEGFSEEEAYEYVSATYNIPRPGQAKKTTNTRLLECVAAAQVFYRRGRDTALEYIKNRGYAEAIVDEYELGFAPDSFDAVIVFLREKGFTDEEIVRSGVGAVSEKSKKVYARQRNRVIFPAKDKFGNIIGGIGRTLGSEKPKYLNPPNSPLFSKDTTIWNLDKVRGMIKSQDRVIIGEGPMDSAVGTHADLPVVAGLGSSLSDEQLTILAKMTKNIYLAFDGDAAGRKALLAASYRIQALGLDTVLYYIALPEGQDIADYVETYGAEGLKELIEEAIPDSAVLVDTLYSEAAKSSTKDSAIARKVLEAVKPFIETTGYSYRALDLLDRLAQKLNLDKGKLDKYLSTGTDFKHNSQVYRKIEAITFPGEIHERRIMTECLKNPANIKILKGMGITRYDIESYLVAKVLSIVDANKEERFAALEDDLSQEEYDTVMSAYMNAETFDINIYELGSIIIAKKRKAQGKASVTNILGRPKKDYLQKELTPAFAKLLRESND